MSRNKHQNSNHLKLQSKNNYKHAQTFNIMPVLKENRRPDFDQKRSQKSLILQGFTHKTKWLNWVWAPAVPSTAKTVASTTPRLDSVSEEHFQYKAAASLIISAGEAKALGCKHTIIKATMHNVASILRT